jgi:hypothetical protein
LIEHIVAWTKDSPMFVLCLARPEFLDGWPAWPGERVELEPLSADDSQTIVGALAPTLDPVSRRRAAQTAEGTPLLLEQPGLRANSSRTASSVCKPVNALPASSRALAGPARSSRAIGLVSRRQ